MSAFLAIIPGRPELSGTLGVPHLHTNQSHSANGTEELEQILPVETDVQRLLVVEAVVALTGSAYAAMTRGDGGSRNSEPD